MLGKVLNELVAYTPVTDEATVTQGNLRRLTFLKEHEPTLEHENGAPTLPHDT